MLDRAHRFHGLNSLSFAYKRGLIVRGTHISLRHIDNTRRQTYRVAVVVSKKVDKSAVVRNRIRRRIYEVIRHELDGLDTNQDLIFTAFNAQLATIEANDLRKQVVSLLRKAGLACRPTAANHAIVDQKKTEES